MGQEEFLGFYRKALTDMQGLQQQLLGQTFEDTGYPSAFRDALGAAQTVEPLPEPPVFRPGAVGALGATLQATSGADRTAVQRMGQKVERTAQVRRDVQRQNKQMELQTQQHIAQLRLGLAQAKQQFADRRSDRMRENLQIQANLMDKIEALKEKEDPNGKNQLELQVLEAQLKEQELRNKQLEGVVGNAKYDEAFDKYAAYTQPVLQQLIENAPGLQGDGAPITVTTADGQTISIQFEQITGTPEQQVDALFNNVRMLESALNTTILPKNGEEEMAKANVIDRVLEGYFNHVAGVLENRARMDERLRQSRLEQGIETPRGATPEQQEIVREATVAQAQNLTADIINSIQGGEAKPGVSEFAEVLQKRLITGGYLREGDFRSRDAGEFVSRKLPGTTAEVGYWAPGDSWGEKYVPWAQAMEALDGVKRVELFYGQGLVGSKNRWRPTRDAEAVPDGSGKIMIRPDRLGHGGLKSLTVQEALNIAREGRFAEDGFIEATMAAKLSNLLDDAHNRLGFTNGLIFGPGQQLQTPEPPVSRADRAVSNVGAVAQ